MDISGLRERSQRGRINASRQRKRKSARDSYAGKRDRDRGVRYETLFVSDAPGCSSGIAGKNESRRAVQARRLSRSKGRMGDLGSNSTRAHRHDTRESYARPSDGTGVMSSDAGDHDTSASQGKRRRGRATVAVELVVKRSTKKRSPPAQIHSAVESELLIINSELDSAAAPVADARQLLFPWCDSTESSSSPSKTFAAPPASPDAGPPKDPRSERSSSSARARGVKPQPSDSRSRSHSERGAEKGPDRKRSKCSRLTRSSSTRSRSSRIAGTAGRREGGDS